MILPVRWMSTTIVHGVRRASIKLRQPTCFVVRDHNGQALAYVYFEDEPGRRSAAKLLTKTRRDGAFQMNAA
jgi:hypothetical protein